MNCFIRSKKELSLVQTDQQILRLSFQKIIFYIKKCNLVKHSWFKQLFLGFRLSNSHFSHTKQTIQHINF